MTTHIVITDPLTGSRSAEPVRFTVDGSFPAPLYWARTGDGRQLLCQRLEASSDESSATFVAVVDLDGDLTLELGEAVDPDSEEARGIRTLNPVEKDAVARLDTGYFDLELCCGTGQGTGASKWGLRHFSAHYEGVDRLPSGNNAIGGFYGPFFTPENGLINPPEHSVVSVETVEAGPVLHHYRLHGRIPDGLLDELCGKSYTIDWVFTLGTPYFERRYVVDDFQTVINGRSITNKITVGDEFEGGPGELVFDRFASQAGTRYRAGDPYAMKLAEQVEQTISASERSAERSEKFEDFRTQLLAGMESAHWDLYWRLFSAWEQALPREEIEARLAGVRASAHVLADLPDRPWTIDAEPVDVSSVTDETIFTGAVQKSVEFHTIKDRAMIWWTGLPSGAFQIVQRKQSGWVNWGSNGENECPELPTGVPIKTAYGPFRENWQTVADQLATPVQVAVK